MDINDVLLHMQDLISEIESGGWTAESESNIRASYSCLRDAVMKIRCDDLYQARETA